MGKYWLTFEAFAFVLLAYSSFANAGAAEECLNGLRPALVLGGFTGSVDCRQDRLSIKKVGEVRTQWHNFAVFSYRYKLKPVCSDCAIHGGQRIVIMDHGRYVGQYRSDFVRASIQHGNLVLEAVEEAPMMVAFTRNGPPDEILVDGEVIHFSK